MRLIGNAEKDAQVRAMASGALPSGDAVIVNSDETVSVVAETSISEGTGSPSVLDSSRTQFFSTAFDSSTNKVIVSYTDYGNANSATVVVGTVSGTSISFGSPVSTGGQYVDWTSVSYDSANDKIVVAYNTGGSGKAIVGTISGTSVSFGTAVNFAGGNNAEEITSVYDSNSGKIVISYKDTSASNYGKSVVGTVSGTSISFGSAVTFNSSATYYVVSTFDSTNNKVILAYKDGGNNFYGAAIVGDVSGTSISFGSEVVFESANTDLISLAHDTAQNKTLFSYKDNGNSQRGTARVATVSGTSISFGTVVTFTSSAMYSASETTSSVYNSLSGKVYVIFADGGNSNRGTIIPATISGTSVTFGSTVVFETGATAYPSAVYDSNSSTVVVAYEDEGNSQAGTGVVYQAGYSTTNLTSENFLGFAAHTYADTQSALVNSTCTVDRNQSGLTAGQTYYVQTDGSLGTTAADPSVVAGTAISSTEIIVKG